MRNIHTFSKTGSTRLDLTGNSNSAATTLNAQLISLTTGNLNIRDGGDAGLTLNAANLLVTGGELSLGHATTQSSNTLRGANVSGTTSVTGGMLHVNVVNSTSNSYSLGHLNVDGGTVNLNLLTVFKGETIANISGLSGTAGVIQSAHVSGGSGNLSTLVITAEETFSSSTSLRNGVSGGGTMRMVKAGSGTQTLSGSSTFRAVRFFLYPQIAPIDAD